MCLHTSSTGRYITIHPDQQVVPPNGGMCPLGDNWGRVKYMETCTMHDNNAGLSSGKSWHSNQHSIWINISKPQPILQLKQQAIRHDIK